MYIIFVHIFFKPVFTRSLIQNSLDDSKSLLFESELEQGTLGFNDEDAPQKEQELVILNLVSMDKSNFDINQVHTLLKNLDAIPSLAPTSIILIFFLSISKSFKPSKSFSKIFVNLINFLKII